MPLGRKDIGIIRRGFTGLHRLKIPIPLGSRTSSRKRRVAAAFVGAERTDCAGAAQRELGRRACHPLDPISFRGPEVVMRNTASALVALFVTVQILLLSTSPTAAIQRPMAYPEL